MSKTAGVIDGRLAKREESGSENNVATATQPAAQRNYETAVATGFYQRDLRGMEGKYDNVRRYWEDQITRYALHPFVEPLVRVKRQQLSRIRVADLGAGAGEGYEILSGLKKQDQHLPTQEVDLLPPEMIGYYLGVDISKAMVDQGNAIYSGNPKVEFAEGDLAEGLGAIGELPPFDIYFSSYSSLSHLSDEELSRLVCDVHRHAEKSYVFVADLMGRYSFEWQCYWDQSGTDETNMRQYSMSYLYPQELLGAIEVQRFPMRYWGGEEFDEFLARIVEREGGRIQRRQVWDRSVLVGRHMNTAEYNPHAQPIRSAVNSLHTMDQRTDLHSLIFDYTPRAEFLLLNRFFDRFQMAWNGVVHEAILALQHWNDPDWLKQAPDKHYPEVVRDSIRTIRDCVRHVRWFRMGDPRANVVEPQLGYTLRNLEMDFQQGHGCGHGLLAVYHIEKGDGDE